MAIGTVDQKVRGQPALRWMGRVTLADGLELREATIGDVAAMMAVRIAVRENRLSTSQLSVLGIDETTLADMLASSHSAHCVVTEGRVVGFAMGDRRAAEIFALFVLPQFEGRGAGSALLAATLRDLAARGHDVVTLTTDPRRGAYEYYVRRGWRPSGFAANGDAILDLDIRSDDV